MKKAGSQPPVPLFPLGRTPSGPFPHTCPGRRCRGEQRDLRRATSPKCARLHLGEDEVKLLEQAADDEEQAEDDEGDADDGADDGDGEDDADDKEDESEDDGDQATGALDDGDDEFPDGPEGPEEPGYFLFVHCFSHCCLRGICTIRGGEGCKERVWDWN